MNWHLSAKAALRRHGGITDKDGCRKPATLLIPLKEEEAELWKNHELDDDALMKIALSFEFSIEAIVSIRKDGPLLEFNDGRRRL